MNWLQTFGAALLLWGAAMAHAAEVACPPPVLPDANTKADSAAAQDFGMLWRLQRDGRTSYLYGSMHIGRPAWSRPGPALQDALQKVDVLALELDGSDSRTQAALARSSRADKTAALPPPLQARLDAQSRAACLPAQSLAPMHPMLQLSTLTILMARWDGLDMAYGQELMLTREARARGLPIVGLERAEDQMNALIPKDRKSLLRSLDEGLKQLEQGRVRPALLRLANAWERGDLGELQRYEQWCDCVQSEEDRAWLRRLNDARNPHLAAGIASLHGSGRRVLAAVGALHMSGPQALPRLLAAKGFTVQQLHPVSNPN